MARQAHGSGGGQELTGLRKAAIVLSSLDESLAAELLRRLPRDAARRLRAESRLLAATQDIGPHARHEVLEEFLTAARELPGLPVPYHAPAASAPPQSPPPTRFSDLHDAAPDALLHTIRDEHPQTIALVVAHLPPEQAGELLGRLEPHRKAEVVRRLGGVERTSDAVIEQVERALRERLRAITSAHLRPRGGDQNSDVFSDAPGGEGDDFDAAYDDVDPGQRERADHVRRVAAIFEELLHAPDDDIRAVIEQLDRQTITLALRTAREELKRKVLWNMVEDVAAIITRDMASGSPVHVREIVAAQQVVAEVVFRLETAGEIGRPAAAGAAGRGGR
jgi:flagellar motor switch protein FliG